MTWNTLKMVALLAFDWVTQWPSFWKNAALAMILSVAQAYAGQLKLDVRPVLSKIIDLLIRRMEAATEVAEATARRKRAEAARVESETQALMMKAEAEAFAVHAEAVAKLSRASPNGEL